MIITIDGPAGAGKSTVAKLVAMRLGYRFLDTGAMYRAVTWAAIEEGLILHDRAAVAAVAAEMEIEFRGDRVLVDDRDVTLAIRSEEVTAGVSEVADNTGVRQELVLRQREIAANGNFVCEGRDQGTIVFPDAECKIYLTASAKERAQRRWEQMIDRGQTVELESILRDQQKRDQRDLERPVGGLLKARDAIEIISDHKSIEQVVDEIVRIARGKGAGRN